MSRKEKKIRPAIFQTTQDVSVAGPRKPRASSGLCFGCSSQEIMISVQSSAFNVCVQHINNHFDLLYHPATLLIREGKIKEVNEREREIDR